MRKARPATKGNRYVEVPLDAFDAQLTELGFAPDESARIASGEVEVSYSKGIQAVTRPCPTKFIISVVRAPSGDTTGKSLQVEAAGIDKAMVGAIHTAQSKRLDACQATPQNTEGRSTLAALVRTDGFRVVYPKGPAGDVAWVIQHTTEVRGQVIVRVYTSITTRDDVSRGVGEDAIRVCVLFREGQGTEGRVRGLGHETRVNRVGTIVGVMQRVSERIVEAQKMSLVWCQRCGGPAYGGPGYDTRKGAAAAFASGRAYEPRCIDKDCLETKARADAQGEPCAHCGGATYTDSGRCLKKTCDGYRIQQSWAKGGPCQKCGGNTYTDSGKCIDKPCRDRGGRADPVDGGDK